MTIVFFVPVTAIKIANAPLDINWTYCSCTGICQIWLQIWPEPDSAGFPKNGRILDLLKPKSGKTLHLTQAINDVTTSMQNTWLTMMSLQACKTCDSQWCHYKHAKHMTHNDVTTSMQNMWLTMAFETCSISSNSESACLCRPLVSTIIISKFSDWNFSTPSWAITTGSVSV